MQYPDPGQSPAVDLLNQRFTATSAPTQDIACNTLTYVSARKGLPTLHRPGDPCGATGGAGTSGDPRSGRARARSEPHRRRPAVADLYRAQAAARRACRLAPALMGAHAPPRFVRAVAAGRIVEGSLDRGRLLPKIYGQEWTGRDDPPTRDRRHTRPPFGATPPAKRPDLLARATGGMAGNITVTSAA